MKKLPKEITSITQLSKYLALVLFISLPIIGFFHGKKYQSIIDYNIIKDKDEIINLLESDLKQSLHNRAEYKKSFTREYSPDLFNVYSPYPHLYKIHSDLFNNKKVNIDQYRYRGSIVNRNEIILSEDNNLKTGIVIYQFRSDYKTNFVTFESRITNKDIFVIPTPIITLNLNNPDSQYKSSNNTYLWNYEYNKNKQITKVILQAIHTYIGHNGYRLINIYKETATLSTNVNNSEIVTIKKELQSIADSIEEK